MVDNSVITPFFIEISIALKAPKELPERKEIIKSPHGPTGYVLIVASIKDYF
jgi:hypothetical protein